MKAKENTVYIQIIHVTEFANLSTEYFVLSNVYTDEGGIE